jgi:hypothetical protein
VCKCTVVSHVSSCIAQTTLSSWTKSGSMFPLTAKVALDSKASHGRMAGGRKVAVGADIVGAVLSIVTSMTAPKTFGEGGSRESADGNVHKASGSRQYGLVIPDPYHEGLIKFHCLFV